MDRGAAQLIGVDQSPQFIDIARKSFAGSNSPTQFLAADMHALPLGDNSVDILISRHCLHYSEDFAFGLCIYILHVVCGVYSPPLRCDVCSRACVVCACIYMSGPCEFGSPVPYYIY